MHVDCACQCGEITFTAEIDPTKVSICHCTDCQTFSGAPFRVSVPAPEADVHLLTGTPRYYAKTADSGATRMQAFCGTCATALWATSPDNGTPRIFGLRIGTMRQRADLVPTRQIWGKSKLPWVPDLPGTWHEIT